MIDKWAIDRDSALRYAGTQEGATLMQASREVRLSSYWYAVGSGVTSDAAEQFAELHTGNVNSALAAHEYPPSVMHDFDMWLADQREADPFFECLR